MDVRMPDGTIIKNVPEGTTRAELQRRLGKTKEAQAVPVPDDPGITELFFKKDGQFPESEPERASYQLPHPQQTITREQGRAGLPIAGAMAGAATGGSGILVPAITSAFGAGAGEAGKQKLESGNVDLQDVVKEGAKTGVGTLAGGLAFKAIGKAAEKLFNPQPLSQVEQRAANFAERENLPLPLQSGGGGAARKAAAFATLPARLQSQKDAARITQFINRMALEEAPKLAPQAKPVSQVVQKGKEFFKNIYYPAKEAGQEGFDKFVNSVGKDTPIRIGNFTRSIDDALEVLAKRGFVTTTAKGALKSTHKLGKKLIALKNAPEGARTLEDVETIRKEISKLGRTSDVKTVADTLKEAILRDYDDVGAQIGVSARELAEDAISKSAQFFRLKKEFPELEFFSKDFSDDKWIGLLFQGRNAKALTEIRKQSPELYRELSDTWLANIIQNNTRSTDGVIGKILDGQALRKWFEGNRKDLNKVLGKQKTQVLDNFSRYAAQVTESVKKADRDTLSGFEALTRAGAELTALKFQPHIAVPGEVAAYVLAKGLSNPSSKLFKLFTSGPSKTFKGLSKGALMLGGQLAVQPIDDNPPKIKQTLTIPDGSNER